MHSRGVIIGLTGPSGIGKGYAKDYIKAAHPDLRDLTVVTTRQRRTGDGQDRKPDFPVGLFLEGVNSGEIVFAHKPFGPDGDWYGFLRAQILDYLTRGLRIITEIHIDNAVAFKREYGEDVSLIALVAQSGYLERNLLNRASESDKERKIRLETSAREIAMIRDLQLRGLFNSVLELDVDNEHQFGERVLECVDEILFASVGRRSKERF